MAGRSMRLTAVVIPALFAVCTAYAQYTPLAEQNVNMVSGQQWPGGDPFLRQQNEPTVAVSTRNPLHLLAGANDYRSVDIPFNAPARPDDEDTGDAWLGVFKSFDGGNRWTSTLLDGYPQQNNASSPLTGYQAGADAVVRAGNNGMFYYAGIVLNRGTNPLSGVFVARFIDNNNTEAGDPIAFVNTKLIATGTSGQFVDKPWLFVSPATNGGQCTVNGQTFPAQTVFLGWTVLVGNDNNIRTKIYIARSTDCGATWGNATKLSETYTVNQGVSIAVDPTNPNNVYVAWRRFAGGNDPNSIIVAKSTDGGVTFPKAGAIANISPFEQGTTTASIRSNAYPAMACDSSGRVHIAWSQRDASGNGRILLTTSADGATTWSAPRLVDNSASPGHQFMPTVASSGGKLTIAWYDLRDDHSVGTYTYNAATGFYDQSRAMVGNLALGQPQDVFWTYLQDVTPPVPAGTPANPPLVRRHTLDVRVAEVNPASPAVYFASVRATRYKFGSRTSSPDPLLQDLQIDPPNLPMFRQGTVPFIGDYIDVAAYQNAPANVASSVASRVRHIVWTDNRDVRVPLGAPPDWTKYTPVNSPSLGTKSVFDPTQTPPPCTPDGNGNAPFAASRNQNIYTARVTDGLFAGAPGNAKPLGRIQRAFSVFVQNSRSTVAFYRLTITAPASGASFLQFSTLGQLDVSVRPHSSATRTVFVAPSVPAHTEVDISVRELDSIGGSETSGGLATQVALNSDPANPDIGNPDIGNPDIGNSEVYNPDIGNPDIGNPDIGNPDIGNPDIGNPDIGNPDIGNPDIGNPDIGNPDIGNPDIGNPDIGNPDIGNSDLTGGDAKDTSWTATNNGNTTGGFTVKLLKNQDLPAAVKSQLVLNKIYDTPVARGCTLGVEHNRQVIASIPNPPLVNLSDLTSLTDSGLTDTSEKNATMWLAPHETGRITVRLVAPKSLGLNLDASQYVTPVVIAQAANTGATRPASTLLFIATSIVNDAVSGQPYSTPIAATGGVPPYTWTVNFPQTFTIDGNGVVGGTYTTDSGSAGLTVTVTDSAHPRHTASRDYKVRVAQPLVFNFRSQPAGMIGSLYDNVLTASGGFAPLHWTIGSGALPAGLTLADDGTISGTPAAVGASQFVVRVTDSANPPQSRSTLTQQITIVAPPAGCGNSVTVLFDNSNTDAVTNGATSPTFGTNGQSVCLDSIWTYHWNNGQGVTPGTIALSPVQGTAALGPWQAVGSAGQGGAPNVNWTATPPPDTAVVLNGSYSVIDSDPATWSSNALSKGAGFTRVYVRSYTGPLMINTTALPGGVAWSPYSAALIASGGNPPYTWTLDPSTPLATGLSLAPDGTISGTPQLVGTRPLQVVVTDQSQQSVGGSFSIGIPGSCSLPLAYDTNTNASKWFGGDNRAPVPGTDIGPRNVGTGESITPLKPANLASVEIPLVWDGTTDSAPCPAPTLPIELDLRDANGAILASSRATVACGTTGTIWVTFPIQFQLAANTTYNFTWWLTNGFADKVAFDSLASDANPIACGGGLFAENTTGNDLSAWSFWNTHPWDFYIRINTTP